MTAVTTKDQLSFKNMPNMNSKSAAVPLCGADLELWRLENALTKSEAADAFGLRKLKWDELVSSERAQDPLDDPTVAMLLLLYRSRPEAAPVAAPPNVNEFFEFLGLQEDSPQDRENFAILIGRSKPSVYRLLIEHGTPSRPVVRWIEAIRRLRMTSRQSRHLMADVVSDVGERLGLENVLTRGWSRVGTPESGTE